MEEPLLRKLFMEHFGESPERVEALKRHASTRRLYRLLSPQHAAIGVCHDDVLENQTFVDMSRSFRGQGLPVPDVYRMSDDGTAYIEEDLGSETLFEVLQRMRSAEDRFPAAVETLYRQAVTMLPRFQIQAVNASNPPYGRESMYADLHYFRHSFLSRFDIDGSGLEGDFDRLVEHLVSAGTNFFMYRDFQARNIVVRNSCLSFVDYQGGRPGPLQYDVVSLLYQTRSEVPAAARQRLLGHYLAAAADHLAVGDEEFMAYLTGFVIIRLLQTLGTYGKVGLGQQNPDFVTIIPRTVKALIEQVSGGLAIGLDSLRQVLEGLNEHVVTYA